jgi:hypothetical protein
MRSFRSTEAFPFATIGGLTYDDLSSRSGKPAMIEVKLQRETGTTAKDKHRYRRKPNDKYVCE